MKGPPFSVTEIAKTASEPNGNEEDGDDQTPASRKVFNGSYGTSWRFDKRMKFTDFSSELGWGV